MAKPTVLPKWADVLQVHVTTGIANRVEPGSAAKDLGWDFNEKPPRQFDNWLHYITWKWLEFFDGVIDQDVTIGANVVFGNVTGADLTISGKAAIQGTPFGEELYKSWYSHIIQSSSADRYAISKTTDSGLQLPISIILENTGTTRTVFQWAQFNLVKRPEFGNVSYSFQAKVKEKSNSARVHIIILEEATVIQQVELKGDVDFTTADVFQTFAASLDISSVTNGKILDIVFATAGVNFSLLSRAEATTVKEVLIKSIT